MIVIFRAASSYYWMDNDEPSPEPVSKWMKKKPVAVCQHYALHPCSASVHCVVMKQEEKPLVSSTALNASQAMTTTQSSIFSSDSLQLSSVYYMLRV